MEREVPRRAAPVGLRRLAAELRRLRAESKLSREGVEHQVGINSVTLYRIESARARPQRRTLMTLLDLYGVRDEARRAQLVELSKARGLAWLQAYEGTIDDPYSALITLETEATAIRSYEQAFIPGLLQTPEYARTSIAGSQPDLDPENVERRVAVRMKRQEILDRVRVHSIIDEAALRRAVGGPSVMAGQVAHLLGLGPSVTLQVLPFSAGAHPAMKGSFVVHTFDAADPHAAYLDTHAQQVFLEDQAQVASFVTVFDELSERALSPAATTQFLQTIAAERHTP